VSVQETIARVVRVPAGSGSASNSALSGALKRLLDLAVAFFVLALLLPLLLAIAVLVRIDSRGPVLFRQSRIGLGGKPFSIIKFRTMHVLEDGERIAQACEDDPRVTRAGRVLRAFSLDELPQFLNVLAGDMSLVGPRPHARAHDEAFERAVSNYSARRLVKPGLTGWAQINGLRGPLPTTELLLRRTECDLWYARNASISLDLKILAKTPLEVLRRRNAY
jgi:putative colanic acid biosynthesis UDP-glucose lipid carrier transferase